MASRHKLETEFEIPIMYKMLQIDTKVRCDLLVENSTIVEIKAVKDFAPVHSAQLLIYMKLLEAPKGILLSFNAYNLYKDGQRTLINEHFHNLQA